MPRKTPKSKHAPITMVLKKEVSDLTEVGDFCWKGTEEKPVLVVMIPDPGNSRGKVLSRWTINYKNDCDAMWTWNKDKSKPTLVPSLHAVGVWHGHVRDGKLIEA